MYQYHPTFSLVAFGPVRISFFHLRQFPLPGRIKNNIMFNIKLIFKLDLAAPIRYLVVREKVCSLSFNCL